MFKKRRRNKDVFLKISKKMKEAGYKKQCSSKLSFAYIKDRQVKVGRNGFMFDQPLKLLYYGIRTATANTT